MDNPFEVCLNEDENEVQVILTHNKKNVVVTSIQKTDGLDYIESALDDLIEAVWDEAQKSK